MELNIKFDEKMLVATANCVLDEYEYNGKTIREWADLIANPTTNADRIRAMTDEELAEFLKEQTSLAHNYGYECADGEPDFPDGIPADYNYLTWLREEATDG